MPAEALHIHLYLENVRWQLASIVEGLGYDDFRSLSRDDLVARTPEAAEALTQLQKKLDLGWKISLLELMMKEFQTQGIFKTQ